MGYRQRLMNEVINPASNAVRNAVVLADDGTQAFMREKVYGLPKDGLAGENNPAHWMGRLFHQARHGYPGETQYRYTDAPGDQYGPLVARGVPLAAITGAGIGLAHLTHQMQNEFGGPADSQGTLGQSQEFY